MLRVLPAYAVMMCALEVRFCPSENHIQLDMRKQTMGAGRLMDMRRTALRGCVACFLRE